MKIWKILLLTSLVTLAACSSKKDKGQEEDYTLRDVEEGRDITESELDDVDLLDDEEIVSEAKPIAADLVENEEIDLLDAPPVEAVKVTTNEMQDKQASTGDLRYYTVGENETLMLVAFKIYGDYHKWKWLAKWNQASLNGGTSVQKGTQLQYRAPKEEFVWNPKGEPYLIKWGDSLSKISKNVYGNWKWWKKIYNNNRPMIKKPELIFAGFTLYYQKEDAFALK